MPGEHPRQVTLIDEADSEGDFAKGVFGIEDELLGELQALMREPPMRGASDRLLEGTVEVADRKLASARKLLDTDVAAKILAQQLLGAHLPPWRQASLNKLTFGTTRIVLREVIDDRLDKGHLTLSFDCPTRLYDVVQEGAR